MAPDLFFRPLSAGGALYFLYEDAAETSGTTAESDTLGTLVTAELPAYCIAFLPLAAVTPKRITLQETWEKREEQPGVYLFLKVAADQLDQATFVAGLRRYLADPALKHVRFLWIHNPAARWPVWRATMLTIATGAGGAAPSLAQPAYFDLHNYTFAIGGGSTIALNAAKDEDGFTITRAADSHNGFFMATDNGAYRLTDIGRQVALPFRGRQAGCLSFDLTLNRTATTCAQKGEPTVPKPDLARLDVGLRLFYKDTSLQKPALAGQDKAFLSSLHYPFFGEDTSALAHYAAPLTLFPTLDPLHPLVPDRSHFAFVQPKTEAKTSAIPSNYRTNLGYTVHLTPHDANSRLIFAPRPGESHLDRPTPLYLTPAGDFEMTVPPYRKDTSKPEGDTRANNLICGLSGVEYIKLDPKKTKLLCFKPGQAAFAPDFIPDQIAKTNGAEQRLNSDATTAWAYIKHNPATKSPIYYSQPKQALLYRASPTPDEDRILTNDPLLFLEVPVTGLPAGVYLPLFPYGGVTGTLTHYQQMEEQLLNPQRFKRIKDLAQTDTTPLLVPPSTPPTTSIPEAPEEPAFRMTSTPAVSTMNVAGAAKARMMDASPDATDTPEEFTGTTPQGLLATYSSDFKTLNTLLLAKDTAGKDLSLEGLERPSLEWRSPLRSAFQSSQMFLVIADPNSLKKFDNREPLKVIKKYFKENQLTIQGWTFDLDPDQWRQKNPDGSNTVLIFKFLDKPLIEILKDTALWEQPEEFVATIPKQEEKAKQKEIQTVRDRLVQVFEDAIATFADTNAAEKDRDNAAPLARIAASPSWSGMIALNVTISPKGLPPELAALACGIKDGDNFYAQYVGSNGTPVLPKDGKLEAEQSSLFGLLDYQDNSVPETGPSGYAFQVSSLRVQFQNSQITAFSSEVNLTLDRLFDEATRLLNSRSGRNIVIIKGFTEEHDGVITYAFSFSGENYFALPDSHILNNVDIVKATFSTDPQGSDSTVTIGRFTLWGRLNFQKLAEIDLFSFGLETPQDQELLNFNNFADDPGKLALTALESLDRKGIINDNPVLTKYSNLIASGEEIRDSITAIQDEAIEVFQALGSEILAIDDEAVQLAVRASNINKTLKLLDDNDQFLPFSKLVIIMKCNNSADPEFTVDPSQIAFDLAKSKVRPHSLYSKFPLKLVNFVHLNPAQPDTKPKGYLPVKTPLGSGPMPTSGFGLNFELNLGSLGGLSGAAQFVVNLLLVWEPNSDGAQEKAKTFVGFRLPGIGGDPLGFPLQSVLKLSYRNVELIVDRSSGNGNAAYLLKIKKVALKFFVLSFPPNGQTEIVIFGNPDANASNDAVGWYAAYAKEKPALSEGRGRAAKRQGRAAKRGKGK